MVWKAIRIYIQLISLTIIAIPLSGAAQSVQSMGQSAKQTEKEKKSKAGNAPAALQSPFERSADASKYAGTDTCAMCHEEQAKSHNAGPHWKTSLVKSKGPGWEGCESCHGPGKAHVEGGGDKSKIASFKTISRGEASHICLDCHQLGEEHSNFTRSAHAANNVSCVDCHSAHQPAVRQRLLKIAQPQLCYGCHQNIRPDFDRPTHHRVNEGLVTCTNCHNPHGGFLTRQLRATAAQDTVCFTCHTDKQGPFTFEHAPVKTEGCMSCHNPHGSANPRMLKRSNVNLLCLECHTLTVSSIAPAPPTFHNQTQKYQACTMCHVAIHGSNSDATFFKF
jgi:DmsE family decaheme c-type cytochrome